jgi:hypothetical protein
VFIYVFTHSLIGWGRDSLVGIPTGYGLDCQGSIPGRYTNCFLLHSVQTDSGAPMQRIPASLSPEKKRPVLEADHSHPASVEVKNSGAIYLHSPTRLHGVVLN